jgi:lipid-A-disaccharide synthase
MSKKLMISAGEASGELYGALLCREIKKYWPDTEIFGIGGHQMEKEGVWLISRISSVIGFVEILRHVGELWHSFKKAGEALKVRRPDILVIIDYPDFNLALARKAKAAGIPVLYYVSPQVWAWRSGRIHKIAARVNRMAVLFPFEVDCYQKVGLPCEFVGHPITETITITDNREGLKHALGLDPRKPVISLLPGSRPAEIRRHLPVLKEVATKVHAHFPEYQIVVPLAHGTELEDQLPGFVRVIVNRTREALAASEAAAVASGTATLETALLGTPMVVFFKTSFISFHIAKLLVTLDFISLVNLLSGEKVVAEFIQNDATPENIFTELKRILEDSSYRNRMISGLDNIREVMKYKKPSARVASMVGETAGWNST